MVGQTKLDRVINKISDEQIKTLITKDELADGTHLKYALLKKREKEFRNVFPRYYDQMLESLAKQQWSPREFSSSFLRAYLCLEHGVVNCNKPETVKDLDESGGIFYGGDEFVAIDATFFKKGLDDGVYPPQKLLKFIEENPKYTNYFMPLLAATNISELWQVLRDYVKNAKLEDSLRINALEAMLSTTNSKALAYFLNEIDANNFYRLKAINEAISGLGDYSFVLPAKEFTAVLKDALLNNDDKYLSCNFIRAYHYAKTLARIDGARFDTYVRQALQLCNQQSKLAALYALSPLEIGKTHARQIFTDKLSVNELAFFVYKINCELMDEDVASQVFDCLFAMLKNMDKVNYHFKTSEDIPVALDVSKSYLIKILARLALSLNNSDCVAKLDGIYETLREEAQAAYLFEIGDKTKLDKRSCAVRFLKTDNYIAANYYNQSKIYLTYDEAVLVSDFLKTKKEPIKEKIIKEFIASKDKEKIADFLVSCKEDYKIAAGAEMRKAFGKVATDNLKTEQHQSFYEAKSVYKLEYPKAEVNAILKWNYSNHKVNEPLNLDVLNALLVQTEQFVKQNKDYEFKPDYEDTLHTFGSGFHRLKNSYPTDSFECYPLGEQLKQILANYSQEDLSALLVLLFCYNENRKQDYTKLFSEQTRKAEKVYELMANKNHSYEAGILEYLYAAIFSELLTDEFKQRVALTVAQAETYYKYFTARRYLEVLAQSDDKQNLEVVAYALCYYLSKDVNPNVSANVFVKAVEQNILPMAVAEYMIIKWEIFLRGLFEGEKNILRPDYPFANFKNNILSFVQKCIDVELNRGSLATPYSKLIGRNMRIFWGADNYLKAIVALRGLTWARSVGYSSEKNVILSQIVKYSRRSADDTYEHFCKLVDDYKITREELIRATLFNPDFVDYVERYLNFPHLKLAVYYFYAHLNDSLYGEEQERRIEKIKEFSEINYLDFQDGAFDCNWYSEIIRNISANEFAYIYDNAKYVTVGGLHKRAQRFFDAMQGKLSKQECVDRITASRNKDYCLAYSLIPVSDRDDLRERYLFLSEFLRQSGKFGAQRQMSERRAVDIAMENLARNAGYSDTNIFIFEMEAETPSDIFVTHTVDDIQITPIIDDKKFSVALHITKNGKDLSAIPSKYGKHETVVRLRENIKTLNKKFKRVRDSFEKAMCNRIYFTEQQLINISKEKIIGTVLSKLFFLCDNKLAVFNDGQLQDLDGNALHCDALIAHAVDLKINGLLQQAIEYVITNNVKQPFKQALREIYCKSPQENEQEEVLRFKGYNVDLKKCVATLKTKGWGVSEDIGLRKVYYKSNLVAAIFREFDFFYSSDFDDVNRELHGVYFFDRRSEEVVPLKEVDDVTFSETLRDVDLMITVSSNTIYDFELAKSTVEIRHEILKSITSILKLDNVSFLKDNISVKGHYGTYVINIRTGLVFKEGKGNLLLDTVYSVNKALLLDFIDEDPMTADIISKAIVLSNDKAIKDSALLREITE